MAAADRSAAASLGHQALLPPLGELAHNRSEIEALGFLTTL